MSEYAYTARTKKGAVQKGTIIASNRDAALATLSERSLTPILIKEAREKKSWINFKNIQIGGVKTKDKVIMSRQLATMVNAGVPIVTALTTLAEQTESPKLKEALEDATKRVKGGSALSDALEKYPKIFDKVFTSMVRAGEQGGILDEILERIAMQVEKDAEIKSKVKGAMIYPGVITTITFIAFMFLMTVIVPKLEGIFDQFGSELPTNTKIMLAISGFIQDFWWLVIAGIIGLIVGFRRMLKNENLRKGWDRLLLKVPIFGTVVLKVNVARFSRIFSSLTTAGVSVLDSIEVTRQSLGNSVIRDGLADSRQRIKNGETISKALHSVKVLPPIVTQMASVGEETGEIEKVLSKIADFYEKEVDRVISNLTSIIEPLLIIILGSLVGLIVASVFGPISSLSDVVK